MLFKFTVFYLLTSRGRQQVCEKVQLWAARSHGRHPHLPRAARPPLLPGSPLPLRMLSYQRLDPRSHGRPHLPIVARPSPGSPSLSGCPHVTEAATEAGLKQLRAVEDTALCLLKDIGSNLSNLCKVQSQLIEWPRARALKVLSSWGWIGCSWAG